MSALEWFLLLLAAGAAMVALGVYFAILETVLNDLEQPHQDEADDLEAQGIATGRVVRLWERHR